MPAITITPSEIVPRRLVVASSVREASRASKTVTLCLIAVPTNHATTQIPIAPRTENTPRVHSSTGTMMSSPEPRMDANGVTAAAITPRRSAAVGGGVRSTLRGWCA
jgi:hypothetical protein